MQVFQNQPSLPTMARNSAVRRVWSGLLVLAIALASFLHVAHSHDADAPSIYKHHCAYCSTFDRGGAPPPASFAMLPVQPAPSVIVAAPQEPFTCAELRSAGQPRAPPFLQA